jgi:anthranilate synthase/aminodeoxychorismate synthase-like glutamine amidotransferase
VILVIDNYDSFTFNLVQYFLELGAEVTVRRNDAIDVEGIRQLRPSHLVLSPGPCTPDQAGISLSAVKALSGTLPLLGVCLGHQALGQAFGGKVVRAQRVMHGKTSRIRHGRAGLFRGLPSSMQVGRYHSLVVQQASLPSVLEVTARSEDDDEIMALRHLTHPTVGVQFHPESVLTPEGKQLLKNFLEGAPC